MYDIPPELSSLISSRICHDLTNPLGAIANGMELLELSGMADSPETSLINDSIVAAAARVEFFRIAYGKADPSAMISPRAAQKILTNSFANQKLGIRWNLAEHLPKSTAKLLFLLSQCAEAALPYGGEVRICELQTGYQVICSGREVRMDQELWKHLCRNSSLAELKSSQVQFALAAEHMKTIDFTLDLFASDTRLTLTVSPA